MHSPRSSTTPTSPSGEVLSRAVLDRLRTLNDSLAQVRQSVSKIDALAQQRLSLTTTPRRDSSSVSGSGGRSGESGESDRSASGLRSSSDALLRLLLAPQLRGSSAVNPLSLEKLVTAAGLSEDTIDQVQRHLNYSASAVDAKVNASPSSSSTGKGAKQQGRKSRAAASKASSAASIGSSFSSALARSRSPSMASRASRGSGGGRSAVSSRAGTPPPLGWKHAASGSGDVGGSAGEGGDDEVSAANEAWRRATAGAASPATGLAMLSKTKSTSFTAKAGRADFSADSSGAGDGSASPSHSRHSSRHSRGHSVHFTADGDENANEKTASSPLQPVASSSSSNSHAMDNHSGANGGGGKVKIGGLRSPSSPSAVAATSEPPSGRRSALRHSSHSLERSVGGNLSDEDDDRTNRADDDDRGAIDDLDDNIEFDRQSTVSSVRFRLPPGADDDDDDEEDDGNSSGLGGDEDDIDLADNDARMSPASSSLKRRHSGGRLSRGAGSTGGGSALRFDTATVSSGGYPESIGDDADGNGDDDERESSRAGRIHSSIRFSDSRDGSSGNNDSESPHHRKPKGRHPQRKAASGLERQVSALSSGSGSSGGGGGIILSTGAAATGSSSSVGNIGSGGKRKSAGSVRFAGDDDDDDNEANASPDDDDSVGADVDISGLDVDLEALMSQAHQHGYGSNHTTSGSHTKPQQSNYKQQQHGTPSSAAAGAVEPLDAAMQALASSARLLDSAQARREVFQRLMAQTASLGPQLHASTVFPSASGGLLSPTMVKKRGEPASAANSSDNGASASTPQRSSASSTGISAAPVVARTAGSPHTLEPSAKVFRFKRYQPWWAATATTSASSTNGLLPSSSAQSSPADPGPLSTSSSSSSSSASVTRRGLAFGPSNGTAAGIGSLPSSPGKITPRAAASPSLSSASALPAEDDGSAEDIPISVCFVSEEAFHAAEEEAEEMRQLRMRVASLASATAATSPAGNTTSSSHSGSGGGAGSSPPAPSSPQWSRSLLSSTGAGSGKKQVALGMTSDGRPLSGFSPTPPLPSSTAAASAGGGTAVTSDAELNDNDPYVLTGADAEDASEDADALAAVIASWRGGDVPWETDPAVASSSSPSPFAATPDAAHDNGSSLSPSGGLTPAAVAAQSVSPTLPSSSSSPGPRFEALCLRVVYQAGRTGFEEAKDLQPQPGSLVAGRYLVRDYLGSAAFSTAVAAYDTVTGAEVCLKIVKNNKDFLDQSLDEIKLLRYLNAAGDADEHGVLRLHDYFYHREHLIIVTELLKDNLYEFQRYLSLHRQPPYFNASRLQVVARQVLRSLAHIHSLGLIHCDLKPENILIKSYSRCEVKVIDFGSSCFVTDALSSYIQSRSYRAPEVILGLPFGPKIDVWSVGTILAELASGKVLFANDSIQTMLARMTSLLGPFPPHMLEQGRDARKYFTVGHGGSGNASTSTLGPSAAAGAASVQSGPAVYQRLPVTSEREMQLLEGAAGGASPPSRGYALLRPKRTTLALRLGGPAAQSSGAASADATDPGFLDFLSALLQLDPAHRPTASQALKHPWLSQAHYNYGEVEPYVLPMNVVAGGDIDEGDAGWDGGAQS